MPRRNFHLDLDVPSVTDSKRRTRSVTTRDAGRVQAATVFVLLGALLSCADSTRRTFDPAPASAVSEEATDTAWLSRAQRHLEEREYWASENSAGLQAPNRRHALRSYFDSTGVRVVDRTAPGNPELLGLHLTHMGRDSELMAVSPGTLSHAEGRVEIERPGLREWFINTGAGLEQGFTLEARPEGVGDLVLELAVAPATARLDGEAATLVTPTGRRLRYDKLVAVDAGGVQVAARLEVPNGDRLRLVVDDVGAAYPLTIDPLLTATADAQLESNQAGARLGAVAGAGDVNDDGYADVIVGAPLYDAGETDEGAAFVFLGSAMGVADGDAGTAAAQLESDQAGAQLGESVAGAGDVNGDGYADVIVGARFYDAGESNEGAAFVFLGSAMGVADGDAGTAAAQLESDQADARLGESVAGAGDVNGDGYADVIVGAYLYDAGQNNEGAAFVFLGSAAGVADGDAETAAAQLESDQSAAQLGESVAGTGDVNGDGYADVIVGSPGYTVSETDEDGAAFVFLGSAAGITDGDPLTSAAWIASDQGGAQLGYSVAVAGDVNGDGYADVIVGARFYDAGENSEGAAFVFLGSAAGIADASPATAAAQLESDRAGAQLGYSVAGPGDVNGDGYADVIVGAPFYALGLSEGGAAFVFLGSAAGIADGSPATAAAELESAPLGASFGLRVAGAGDVNGDGYADVIVGSPGHDAGETDEGAAFVFLGSALGISDGNPANAHAQLESNQADARLGLSVAGAGDVNGDGYADLILGAPDYDAGENNEGAAFLFLGSATGLADGDSASAHAQLESNQADARLGLSVAGAGDVNGDGYADVIVGADLYDAGESNEGAAFLFLGSATGLADGDPDSAHAQLESNQENALLGLSVAGAGDVNGDGYADVIAGAKFYDAGEHNQGAAFVFLGSALGLADGDPASAHAQLEADQVDTNFGWSVAGAGDVNGDGYADVIVGADLYDAGEMDEGAAFVFLGSATGLADGSPATAAAQLESDQGGARLGASVAGAGDLNGDGYADVIVGAYRYDAGETDEGAAFVFLGSATGLADGDPASAHAQLESNQARAFLGESVAGAGDVNGDGYADVIVGASQYDAGENYEGAAFVFLGGVTGLADGDPVSAHAQLESNQANAELGYSVAGAGDVNGDGYADVIVGADLYDAGETDEGSAFVFLGNGEGRPVRARQRRGDGSGVPVSPWGLSRSDDGFEVEITAHHPAGSGRVKAEVEACPTGVAFGDASCTSQTTASWLVVGGATPEVLISKTMTGLSSDTLYRWRARVLRAEATGKLPAYPARSPWRRLSAQSAEADIRVVPEPGVLVSLLAGIALLGRLRLGARRRKGLVSRASGCGVARSRR